MKKRLLKTLAIILSLALLVGIGIPMNTEKVSAAFSDASVGQLHVDGTVLKDKNGNVIQLRGVSTHGLAWYPDYVNEKFFKELHDNWKANVVRLAMYTEEYNGYCSGDNNNKKSLKTLVKNGVEYAKNNNMYVIVDWHILSDGNPNKNINEAKKFFNEVSKEYSSYTNVIYEICNEPNGDASWSDIKKYANTIIPVIRKNDSDSIIIVGTPTWSQEVDKAAADPLKYDNIMYTLHFYADTHQQWLRERAEAAIKSGLPLFVTEFGICDASGNGHNNKTEGNKWISFLDKNNISYVAWNLSNKEESSALFSSSCSKKSGFSKSDLSDSGKWYYDVLTKHAGSSSSSSGASANNDTGNSNGKHKTTIDVKNKSFSCKTKSLKKAKLFCINASCTSGSKLSYKKISGSKYLSVTSKGKVKVKAKTPKGTYKIKIRIKSKATELFSAGNKTITVKVKVR